MPRHRANELIGILEVKKRVHKALKKLLQSDLDLFERNVNERSITHKLAEYLQQSFADWKVDCEYNRHLDEEKTIRLPIDIQNPDWSDTEAKTVFPDIIIHKRGERKNILAIEAKKSNSRVPDSLDKLKLEAFREPPYNYKFGLFIRFNVGEGSGKHVLTWYTNGSVVEEYRSSWIDLQSSRISGTKKASSFSDSL